MLNLVLKFYSGSFDTGFSGELFDVSNPVPIAKFTFPASPEMPQLYKQWQDGLRENTRLRLTSAGDARLTSHLKKCEEAKRALENCSQQWFRDARFDEASISTSRSIKEWLTENKIPANKPANKTLVRIHLIPTNFDVNNDDNDILRKLPWQLWRESLDLGYDINSTFVLSESQNTKKNSHDHNHVLKSPVRILAIFGSDENGLNQEPEKEKLNQLENNGARVESAKKPNRDRVNDLLWHSKWDILFFSGHSSSQGESGRIQINDRDSLSLNDLKSALKEAVKNGLKIAIFNSCDGLGIANFLTQLKVPAVIVMKEPVPDSFASEFLLNFLEAFVKKRQRFSLAVREATGRLNIKDNDFPGATWLPVIYYSHQNQPDYIWPTPGVITRLLTFLFKFFSPRPNVIKTGVSKIINTFKSKKILFGLTVIVIASIIVVLNLIRQADCSGWKCVLRSIEFSRDGKYLAIVTLDGTGQLFETDKLPLKGTKDKNIIGELRKTTPYCKLTSDDGKEATDLEYVKFDNNSNYLITGKNKSGLKPRFSIYQINNNFFEQLIGKDPCHKLPDSFEFGKEQISFSGNPKKEEPKTIKVDKDKGDITLDEETIPDKINKNNMKLVATFNNGEGELKIESAAENK